MTDSAQSLAGFWYAAGPTERPFDPEDRAFGVHVIVADDHALPGCVTVRNAAGETFPLARSPARDIAVPPPVAADNPHLRRRAVDIAAAIRDEEADR
jgi:hypothetical protein